MAFNFFGGGNGGNGVQVDYNQLFDQMANTYGWGQPTSMSDVFNTGLLNGYNSFAGQMAGVNNAFAGVAALNSANNQALNRANADYATGYSAPVEVARLQQEGQNQRLQALSPLLTGLFGTGGGAGTGGSGGGLTGFNAVGPDGKTFASASLGSGGGSTGGQLGQAQPGNQSSAQPTNIGSLGARKLNDPDLYTPAGTYPYQGMRPTPAQVAQIRQMQMDRVKNQSLSGGY